MIKFGTGGFRAIIGDEFTKVNIQKIAMAIVKKISDSQCKKEIVIGYDSRFLSRESACWFSEVVASNGIKVLFINKSQPTPLIMFAVMKLKLDYGVMITASHNPAIYNGIKIFVKEGRDAPVDVTNDIGRIANEIEISNNLLSFDDLVNNGDIKYLDIFNEYIDSILEKLDGEKIKKSRLRICLDPMFGVSQLAISTILGTLRCNYFIINNIHDTLFGGKFPAPEENTLKYLSYYVVEKNFDLGIATDGDADRLGVIDSKGNYIHANQVLVLLYYYLLKYKGMHGDVVRNNCTTHMLDRIANDFSCKCHEVPVGFKYISSKMSEVSAIIGGESSGGLTIKGHINGKDGIYAASILIEMLAVSGKNIEENLKEIEEKYGKLYYAESSYKLNENLISVIKTKLFEDKDIPEFKYEIEKISYEDGCKIYFENGGWIIVRFSGTEPLIRFASEMSTENEAKDVMNIMKDFLNF